MNQMEQKTINQTLPPLSLQELKQMPVWVCWRSVRKGNRITKVPVSPLGGGTGSDPQHRHTWTNFDTALAASAQKGLDGVGFIIPEGIAFLDLDGITPEDPLAQTLMRLLPCYTEHSVSGTGMHLYMRCNLSRLPTVTDEHGKRSLDPRYYTKNPHNGMELYIGGLTNRFAVFTGDTVADLPLTDCTEGVLTVLDSYMLKAAPPSAPSAPEPEMDPEEEELMALDVISDLRRQKNAAKFSRLYDDGDTTGYRSNSEADLALASMIAFRAGNRPRLIAQIMRSSALRRDKWDSHHTYLKGTIEKAVASCAGIYARESGQLPSFVKLTGRKMDIRSLSAPHLADYIRQYVPLIRVRNNEKQPPLFFVYRDGVYRFCNKEAMHGIIKEPVYRYDPGLVDMKKVDDALKDLRSDLNFVSESELNADESIINFRNGLLRITGDSLTLEPHSPSVYSTVQLPCVWTGRAAPTPVFDRFMESLSDGDPEKAEVLMQYAAVAVSNVPGYRMKKALFHVGPGDTGKSLFKALIENLLGPENCMSSDLKGIEARFGSGYLFGMRLVGSSDMSFLKIPEVNIFKSVTGGDTIFGEVKGVPGFSFVYRGVLWFCMNRLPYFGGDKGSWVTRRMMVVESHTVIPPEKQDKHMLEKLLAEREGILFKLVAALQTVIANGYRYSEPACVIEAREKFMEENSSPIGFFLECMCPRTPNDFRDGITVTKVYDEYRSWCYRNHNGYHCTRNEFRSAIADHLGCSYDEMVVHRENGNYYRDYTLTAGREDFLC